MTRAPLAVCVALAALAGAGCPRAVPFPELATLKDDTAAARLRAGGARRQRLVGTFKARLPGIEGVVASADLDVALQPPAQLSVAVRSFFEQPMQVLVADGATVTVFDATSGAPVFLRGPADERSLALVLALPLAPRDAVAIFLARPPADGSARLVGVDEQAGTFDVWVEAPGALPAQITVRAPDDGVVRWQAFRRDGQPLLDVRYEDLRTVGAAVLPFAWTVTRLDTDKREALRFTATDVIWNGEKLPDDAFRLEPPPGVELHPLESAVVR